MDELWIACDRDSTLCLHSEDPPYHGYNGSFLSCGHRFEVITPMKLLNIQPGQKARLTIGEVIDCNPKPESETEAAMKVLNRAAEKLPKGYNVGVDFGGRAGISVFGNGEVLKPECDSFDIAVEIANDHATEKAKIPELWATRMRDGCVAICRGPKGGVTTFVTESTDVPDLKHGFECRIAWDEHGIRLIGTPEPI